MQDIPGVEALLEVPGTCKAVLFVAHGCQHSATDFWKASETCPTCIGGTPFSRCIAICIAPVAAAAERRRTGGLAAVNRQPSPGAVCTCANAAAAVAAAGLPEELNITKRALARGYAVLAVSSHDREHSGCWELGPAGGGSTDTMQVWNVHAPGVQHTCSAAHAGSAHRQGTQAAHAGRAHRQRTQAAHTGGAHRQCTQAAHTAGAHRQRAQAVHTGSAHRRHTQPVHTGRAHRQCTQAVHTGSARRQRTQAAHAGSAHRRCTQAAHIGQCTQALVVCLHWRLAAVG
jgi:hypothetical protein